MTIETIILEANIRGLGKIFRVEDPFDEALNELKENNCKLISARDLAYARIQDGNTKGTKESLLCSNYFNIREGILYLPKVKKSIALVRTSLCLEHPKEAVERQKNNRELFINEREADAYLKRRDTLIINPMDDKRIPTNRFAENEITVWIFQDQAKDYGLWLKANGAPLTHFNLFAPYDNGPQRLPYASQLGMFDVCRQWSEIQGYERTLYQKFHYLGVQHNPKKLKRNNHFSPKK